jgi:TRAP-type C4-dicarboxylate transport system permease large subunit
MTSTLMSEITRAAIPVIVIQLIVMALLVAIPPLSLWLPGFMNR